MCCLRRSGHVFCLLVLLILASPVSALYSFEGIPLEVKAQGEVQGDLLTFGTYGLADPPVDCTFSLNTTPLYARAYAGVWGGNEKYTGWVEMKVNDADPIRIPLGGIDDAGSDVYAAGHGVYWAAAEVTPLLGAGENTVSVSTSRGETGTNMDGRVYAVYVVVTEEDPDGPLTAYRIAEGNENLHGEGWAGDLSETNNRTTLSFGDIGSQFSDARLSLVLLATQRGQPDYVSFNGHDLGTGAAGVRDIGDEVSFDADGGPGIRSRYMDAETFDVTGIAGGENLLTFERGRDLDGDGSIATTGADTEGEDYIHPVCAVLVASTEGLAPAPDFSLDTLEVTGAYSGRTADLAATLRNAGSLPEGPVTVTWTVDGQTVAATTVDPASSGVQTVTAQWEAEEGSHEIAAAVAVTGDRDQTDNAVSKTVTVGSLPDLAVAIGTPYAEGSTPEPTASPLPLLLPLAAAGIVACRRSRGALTLALVVLLVAAACAVPSSAVDSMNRTIFPVTVSNAGGSDAPPFSVAVFVDGEETTLVPFEDGLPAGGAEQVDLPVVASQGEHIVRVVADPDGAVADADQANNMAEVWYVFP